MLTPQFEAKSEEKEIYQNWEKLGVFQADPKSSKKPYTIVLPPPNVTGVLHMGHALTGTLEDILIRRKRMQGLNALYVPGTDHAGIATQMVVERNLAQAKKPNRHELGREKFLEEVWAWKEKSQGTIIGQLKTLGCSLDWSRLTFTLDENVSLAVRECFTRLYRDGLIYREEAPIQWCPRCLTALSDLEVKFKELKGKLYQIRYPSVKNPEEGLVVATTRPETLLGDVAVAVNPDDERYRKWIGTEVRLPLTSRTIPVIADSYVDIAFGTGALKITPSHDPNDYSVGKRHGLPLLSVFDDQARIGVNGGAYQGLSREKAREKMLEDLRQAGLLVEEKDHPHQVGHCDRCGTVVEPKVSAQWFVKAEVLAKPAIKAVENGEIKIYPKEWEKTYFEWMNNIRPWCISRQLWWGHRIPVWYCAKCPGHTVAVETPIQCEHCGAKEIRQEEDVLDTWFSSGLWPFSTLGWPRSTEAFQTFYPNDVLETGFDILFFWVARMIMLGIRMTGKIPFHTVYLHPMVRDEYGQKMSKTKGNVVDPLEIIDRMGADALRFYLTWNAFHGRDLRVSDDGVEGCRNFVTKIWNAAKFVMLHFGDCEKSNRDLKNEVNQWIWSRLNETKRTVKDSLDQYRFFEAAQSLYHFLWNDYCDWFIELIKSKEEMDARKLAKETTAIEVLGEVLRLLHPIMPFVTERVWLELKVRENLPTISLAAYPEPNSAESFPAAEKRIGLLISVVEKVRATRGVYQVSPSTDVPLVITGESAVLKDLEAFRELLSRLARASQIEFSTATPPTATHLSLVLKDVTVFLPKASLGDISKEIERRTKELGEKRAALQRAEAKISNQKFMQGAPEAVRQGVIQQKEDLEKEVSQLEAYLKEAKA